MTNNTTIHQITITAHPNVPPHPYEAASSFDDKVFTAKTIEHAIGKISKHINPELTDASPKVITEWLQTHASIKLKMSST